MSRTEWPKVAVMGAGAVGCYFGGMLARAGAPVTLIGRQRHIEVLVREGLYLDSPHFRGRIPVVASTETAAARDAQVVLFCVKTLDTETAARALAPHLRKDALVLSLQNGVDNVERIRSASGIEAVPAVVYVAAEMTGPGRVTHSGRGDLVIGRRAETLATLFTEAGVPCVVSDNVAADLWTKLIMNCAYNAISALSRARYGLIVSNILTRDLMRSITEEVVAVGHAAGVRFPEVDLVDAVMKLGRAMSNATSSTAQDIARGKRTEIDSLNGFVVRRAAELGVPAPVNETLYALVNLLENEEEEPRTE